MAKVLVTGGAGYIGSVCSAELLRQGHAVTVVDDLSTGFRDAVPSGASFVKMEIGEANHFIALIVMSEDHAVASELATSLGDAVIHGVVGEDEIIIQRA